MRLIHNETLQLEEVFSNIPPYAILSHTWGPEGSEVTFEDMTGNVLSSPAVKKQGFEKIRLCCRLALYQYRLKYSWIDTCCINKSSSAELTEAINSMFKWYKEANICLAFLEDVTDWESFHSSRWFTRGWTLQELIAPKQVIFYDGEGNRYGTKNNLRLPISRITGISVKVFEEEVNLESIPVAVRMSWAATRQTTREEDMAYCLLGLFNISMPMLYGEGPKAFIRLQEEIIRETSDMSIFAWVQPYLPRTYHGLLAESVNAFQSSDDLRLDASSMLLDQEFSVTNRGIKFSSPLKFDTDTGVAILPLGHVDKVAKKPVGIALRQIGPGFFVRERLDAYIAWPPYLTTQAQSFQAAKFVSADQDRMILENTITVLPPHGIEAAMPQGCFHRLSRTLITGYSGAFYGYVHFRPSWVENFDSFVVVICLTGGKFNLELCCGKNWNVETSSFLQLSLLQAHGDRSDNTSSHCFIPHRKDRGKAMYVIATLSTPTLVRNRCELEVECREASNDSQDSSDEDLLDLSLFDLHQISEKLYISANSDPPSGRS